MRGTLGPYTSPSSRPTLNPMRLSATARFTEMVVLPTPPLPEPMATTFWMPGSGCGPCCGGAPCGGCACVPINLDYTLPRFWFVVGKKSLLCQKYKDRSKLEPNCFTFLTSDFLLLTLVYWVNTTSTQ